VTIDGEPYLVPQDGGTERTSIPVAWVQGQMAASRARSKVLILDACHSGRAVRGVEGIAPSVSAEAGLVLLASCAEGEVSYPDDGQGVFTRYLTEGLAGPADSDDDGEITAAELHTYVSDHMEAWSLKTGKTQRPQMLPPDAGDVVIARLK